MLPKGTKGSGVKLLAIDPSSTATGYAVFEGDQLVTWDVVKPLSRLRPDQKVTFIVDAVGYIGIRLGIEAMAIEQPFNNPRQRNHAYHLTYQAIIGVAKGNGWKVAPLHNSTVRAAVRPKLPGVSQWPAKAQITAGVVSLYPQVCADQDQNAIDAIAVGHCYLAREYEKNLEKRMF